MTAKDFSLIDLNVQWLNDLKGQRSMMFGNQGACFGQILSHSKVLFESNPFDGLGETLLDKDR